MSFRPGIAALLLLVGTLLLQATPARAVLANTKHNLSVSGPGAVRATSETQTCVFCHAPHNSSPNAPLWNRRNPAGSYTPYASSTAQANAGQPTGASLNCLSCHDGTIALGEVLSRSQKITMAGGTNMPAGNSNLGTDLSDDHPISINYNASLAAAHGGELADPSTLTGKVKLDASGQLQCTSCHDPHDDTNGKFLVMSNQSSALCQMCHIETGWSSSSHKLSNSTWNGVGTNPWPHTSLGTVSLNACESCHRPHTAGGKRWLLNYSAEESNCYSCHNGNVATKNIQSEFNKTSIHPVAATTGVHDAAESSVIQSRHVECADCHNSHATNSSTGLLPGSLAGVRGITIDGIAVKPVTAEYQVCFRCHGDSSGAPAPKTTRQLVQGNVRLQFTVSNPSFHPIAGIGKNTSVPSLISPWTISSTMVCGDCHNNNAGPNAGGTGPKGPHGSTYPSLLERQYLTTDRTTESASTYALCYKCHTRSNFITDGVKPFPRHKQHVIDERTPCNVCHDPHGVSSTQGNPTNNSKLINFNTVSPGGTAIVTPRSINGVPTLRFVQTATGGYCDLVCHGKSHSNNESYTH